MLSRNILFSLFVSYLAFATACGINSVSREELENVKPGNVLTYRYRESDSREWFYADKITRVEDGTVYFYASKKRSTKSSDSGIKDFDTTQELSMKTQELVNFAVEQGDNKKKVIWIE